MTKAIQRAVASYGGVAKIKPFPWWFIYMPAPFRATLREILEMRYLGRQPVRLHNAKLVKFLGSEPHTPLDDAVHMTLRGLGWIADRPAGTGA